MRGRATMLAGLVLAGRIVAAVPAAAQGTILLPRGEPVKAPRDTADPDAGLISAVSRGPYLQSGTPTSVVVRWRTGVASDSVVRYGDQPGSLTESASNPDITTEHVVPLSGLQPDTRYYYSVGTSAGAQAGGDSDHSFVTSPPPGAPTPTRIWVIGDSGTADSNAAAVRDAYAAVTGSARTDLWLMLGDNAYNDGTDSQYQAAVFDMYPDMLRTSVLWPTLGNHDGHTADSATQSGPYYDIFTLPRQGEAGGLASGTEAYYSFDYGNIHFACLESHETDRSPSGAMMTWLQQDLMWTTRDWIIAFWHHPPYTKGSHNSDAETQLIEMRTSALPILEAAGVDLVLTGHSHSYERSFLLDGHYGFSNTLIPAMKIDPGDGRIDGDGAYRKPTAGPTPDEGAVYVVAGSSGKTSGGSLNHPAMYVSLNELGSLALTIDGNRLEAQFIDHHGDIRDYFTLFKGPLDPPEADFTGRPVSGPLPLLVGFTDLTTNGPSGRAWDFQDDGIVDSTLRHPNHVYWQPGLYSVRLTAYDGAVSDDEVKTDYVCVMLPGGWGDVDGDGVVDGSDTCPCLADPGQEDADGDGLGDACDPDDDNDGVDDALDCAPLDPSAGRLPDVGDTLALGPGTDTITWSRPPGARLSHVYRGTVHAGSAFHYKQKCIAGSVTVESIPDRKVPHAGELFYYLVSAVNVCGEGPLGYDSAGAPRPNSSPCPDMKNQANQGNARRRGARPSESVPATCG